MFNLPAPEIVSARRYIAIFELPFDTRLVENIDQLKAGMWARVIEHTTKPDGATFMHIGGKIKVVSPIGIMFEDGERFDMSLLSIPPTVGPRSFSSDGSSRYLNGNAVEILDPPDVKPSKPRLRDRIKAALRP